MGDPACSSMEKNFKICYNLNMDLRLSKLFINYFYKKKLQYNILIKIKRENFKEIYYYAQNN